LEHRRAIGGRYTSVDQLLDVSGIGAKTLARLRPYLVVR
ncbi:MAG: helix-hairpin-helix domain-containing protein, partial [Bifidobacteriales bacterium]|nr:helix-hairpin-helix domain-containing protein [Bifidobacteriales bacterium]